MMKNIYILTLITALFIACSSDDDNGGSSSGSDGFERKELLVNWADNIIIPSYDNFNIKLGVLKTEVAAFVASPDNANLTTVRAAWLEAYKSWQHVEMFNIGKAEEIQYSFFMNIYPVNTSDVEANILSGSYDLDHPNNHDAQGFPSLDYLLYGVGSSDVAILEKYTTNSNASGYKKYLTDVLNQMDGKTKVVVADWKGAYRSTFVSSTTNTSTSSVNKMVNDYIYYFEKSLRAGKIGIPAGVYSATTRPQDVEAFYKKDISKIVTLEALNASIDFFNGKHFTSDDEGESLKTYLEYLRVVQDGENLADIINSQFAVAKAAVDVLNDDYTAQIATDNSKMTKAFDELQKVVIKLKVDMLQALNISVDYIDADGD